MSDAFKKKLDQMLISFKKSATHVVKNPTQHTTYADNLRNKAQF